MGKRREGENGHTKSKHQNSHINYSNSQEQKVQSYPALMHEHKEHSIKSSNQIHKEGEREREREIERERESGKRSHQHAEIVGSILLGLKLLTNSLR